MYFSKQNLKIINSPNLFACQGDFEIRVVEYQFDKSMDLKEERVF